MPEVKEQKCRDNMTPDEIRRAVAELQDIQAEQRLAHETRTGQPRMYLQAHIDLMLEKERAKKQNHFIL